MNTNEWDLLKKRNVSPLFNAHWFINQRENDHHHQLEIYSHHNSWPVFPSLSLFSFWVQKDIAYVTVDETTPVASPWPKPFLKFPLLLLSFSSSSSLIIIKKEKSVPRWAHFPLCIHILLFSHLDELTHSLWTKRGLVGGAGGPGDMVCQCWRRPSFPIATTIQNYFVSHQRQWEERHRFILWAADEFDGCFFLFLFFSKNVYRCRPCICLVSYNVNGASGIN